MTTPSSYRFHHLILSHCRKRQQPDVDEIKKCVADNIDLHDGYAFYSYYPTSNPISRFRERGKTDLPWGTFYIQLSSKFLRGKKTLDGRLPKRLKIKDDRRVLVTSLPERANGVVDAYLYVSEVENPFSLSILTHVYQGNRPIS